MAREGVARVSVTSETAPPCPTGEELSDMLEKAFLGPDFSHVLDEAITACAANHAKGQSYCFRTNSYKDSYVYPGKKFPTKCFIQHSRFNIQAATRLGDFIHRFSGDSCQSTNDGDNVSVTDNWKAKLAEILMISTLSKRPLK